jgi:hypothetical protein
MAVAVASLSAAVRAQPRVEAPPQPLAAPAPVASRDIPNPSNHPPTAPRFLPRQFDRDELFANVGRTLRFTVVADDPEGQPVRIRAVGLPPTATFDEASATFTFAPTQALRGEYVVRFIASDGFAEKPRALTVKVADNHPPQLTRFRRVAPVDETSTIAISNAVSDQDSDPLSYRVSSLPKGATLDDRGVIRWAPTLPQVGEYRLDVTVSDGLAEAAGTIDIEVVESGGSAPGHNEWSSYLLPGAGYSVYMPRDQTRFGTFHGVALEILIGSWIHRNNNRGPSHGRVYVQGELARSTQTGGSLLFAYALGFSLSLERNPHRRWLLPVYGLDIGGITSEATGGHFQALPYAGLHLYSSPNIFMNLRAGYRIVPGSVEQLGGWHLGATLDYSIW